MPDISATKEFVVASDLSAKHKRLGDILTLRNPLILGSGPLGRNAQGLVKHGRYAGAVVGKSTTWLPQKGNPHPRIVSLGAFGLINWENLPNLGYKRFAEEVRLAKAECACPIIASLGPSNNLDQIKTMAATLEEAGADALELDFKWGYDPTSGHTGYDAKKGGGVFGADAMSTVLSALRQTVSMPLIAKLITGAGDIVELAKTAEAAGAAAVTAIN
ncbi:MAG: hypothetical protein FJ026_16830, partial [Chloroflexi bacterium]|nr:hypothetical protein [Chloroflexota bacterium]